MAIADPNTLWQTVLEVLKARVASGTFDMFFVPLQPMDAVVDAQQSGVFLLLAPNMYFREWVASHYGALIEEQLHKVTGVKWSLRWTVPTAENRPSNPAISSSAVTRKPAPRATAALRSTLDTKTKPVVPASALAALAPDPTTSVSATLSLSTPKATRSVSAAAAMGLEGAAGATRSMAPRATATAMSTPNEAFRATSTISIAPSQGMGRGLHPRYTFENFIMGPSNQLAYGAAMSAADFSGRRFNPLFLYGGTGLGKTHLVNAIGHQVLAQFPDAKIVYVSAEQFTNEFVAALSSKTMDAFRQRYREHCDVLLMDDVQFFAGRVQTEEEFFHTFNALYLRERPIVLTSDVAPQDLKGMAERLVSRFGSGLVADVYPPELETRIAILRKKAELENITIDDEGAYLLANTITSNVRQLEGMLIKLSIQAGLARRTGIDSTLVREALRIPTRHVVLTVDDIQRSVAEHYRVKVKDILGKERHQGIALPRQIAMYLCRERLGVSFPQIGAKFGGKDHTTVIAAVTKIKKMLEEDHTVRKDIEAIQARLGVSHES